MAAPRAQVVCRPHGYSKCPSHTGQKLSLCCINCDTLVCVRCVTSRFHRGHEFEDLSEAVQRETEKLQQILNTNENSDLVQIKNDVSSIKIEMAKNKVKHDNISALIKLRVREIKEEADKQAEILLGDCEENETENHGRLLDYQARLENQQRDCEEQINMLKMTLQSGNEIGVFDTRHSTKSFVLGSAPLKLAAYQPSTSVSEVVSMALGSLVWPMKQSKEQRPTSRPLKHNPTAERWQQWPKAERLQAASRIVSGGNEPRKHRRRLLAEFTNNFDRLTDLMQIASSDEDSDTGASKDDVNDELEEIIRRHLNNN
ncbi:uncharacterized protein LOC110451817 isoform X2 [Mizuhopecten yessoensis]|uniref:uncharacterized protein LOC110451817 isoform X2 n=1 Tax=Mizuhopecten yessoensis TaxID=6573 RepID=UPI000B45F217|nr:uncharacterized protein LOC110451817 isoform X2 [Mizuhopecten yessoensis]